VKAKTLGDNAGICTVKALVDTVADTLAETKAVILAITMGDIEVEALAERLAVSLTKAECLVATLSDAVTRCTWLHCG